MNCDEEVNTQSGLTATCICSNCLSEGFRHVSYQWELNVKNKGTGVWRTMPISTAVTNSHQENLVLKRDFLSPDSEYKLICRGKIEGKSLF